MLNQLCWGGSEVIFYYGPMLRVSQIRLYFGRRKIGCILIRVNVACSRLSWIVGEHTKEKGTRKAGGEGKRKGVSSRFIFVFAVSQFSGPDYFGAWNRLGRM